MLRAKRRRIINNAQRVVFTTFLIFFSVTGVLWWMDFVFELVKGI